MRIRRSLASRPGIYVGYFHEAELEPFSEITIEQTYEIGASCLLLMKPKVQPAMKVEGEVLYQSLRIIDFTMA